MLLSALAWTFLLAAVGAGLSTQELSLWAWTLCWNSDLCPAAACLQGHCQSVDTTFFKIYGLHLDRRMLQTSLGQQETSAFLPCLCRQLLYVTMQQLRKPSGGNLLSPGTMLKMESTLLWIWTLVIVSQVIPALQETLPSWCLFPDSR